MEIKNLHADHVGSLLRPAALRGARERLLGIHDTRHNLGAHSNAELQAIEDECIRDVVRLQEQCGLDIVTDGEFRRRSWWIDVVLSFTGTRVIYNGKNPLTFINASGEQRPGPSIVIDAPILWRESVNARATSFLKSITSKHVKVSLPGPPMIHFMREDEFVPSIYKTHDLFWADVIAAYKREIDELAIAGCRHIQIDECMFAFLCDPRHQHFSKTRGEDPHELIKTYCSVINQAVAERPADMTIALHSCRGNLNAYWGSEGGYEAVADLIFNHLDVDLYLLEYDTDRAGSFEPLQFLPKGKKVLLGLISTKEPKLEEKDLLKRRIEEAGRFADHEQLGICPQCGFASNFLGTSFTIDDERRKLDLLVDVARDVWN